MNDRVTIAAGDWSLDLAPAIGGAVTALRYRGADILRPAFSKAAHPLQTACFPMVPFVGRIAHGTFTFRGRGVTLQPNLSGDAHVLHGFAWLEPWQVTDSRPGSVALEWACRDRDGWPWDHRAEQRFTLDSGGLHVALTVTNTGAEAMPVGIGLHPYFHATGDTHVRFVARHLWSSDATLLPVARVPVAALGDWAGGARLPAFDDIDHSYEDWDGIADITGAHPVRVEARGARDLHLYAPAGAGFFCLEPCSHLPDAFNRGDRFDMLEPGASSTIAMRIDVATR